MDLVRLHTILQETTVPIRKDEEIESDPRVVKALKKFNERVDLHYIIVGVNKIKAQRFKDELVAILKTYPQPKRIAGAIGYLEMGYEIGDQGAALRLFALGEVLDLWEILVPERLGFTGREADEMAGNGWVLMSGFKTA